MYLKIYHFYFNIMRKIFLAATLLIVSLFSSCELVGDIFKAGAYTAIIAIVVIIAVIIWIISHLRGKS